MTLMQDRHLCNGEMRSYYDYQYHLHHITSIKWIPNPLHQQLLNYQPHGTGHRQHRILMEKVWILRPRNSRRLFNDTFGNTSSSWQHLYCEWGRESGAKKCKSDARLILLRRQRLGYWGHHPRQGCCTNGDSSRLQRHAVRVPQYDYLRWWLSAKCRKWELRTTLDRVSGNAREAALLSICVGTNR